MELNNIDSILEKYLQGETSVAEEKELKVYFNSSDVAPHLKQYQPMFIYFSQAKEQKFTQVLPLETKKSKVVWLSIAASAVVLLGIGSYLFMAEPLQKRDLGTYDNPEVALKETQKALAMLSGHVNVGIESVNYINEYEESKNLIFKQ
ncbi:MULTISPECIES: hypothetical protein [unclassified Flavobacterium]|uniref:hypothetical protein n=1 Tax=unclassified Flavobacterium TaxID=196869 RepID=UPI003F91A27C